MFVAPPQQFNVNNDNNLDLLLNNTSNYSNLFTNDTNMVHDGTEVLLNESLLDDLFKSPIKNHQNDPLISNTFNDNIMDSINT